MRIIKLRIRLCSIFQETDRKKRMLEKSINPHSILESILHQDMNLMSLKMNGEKYSDPAMNFILLT